MKKSDCEMDMSKWTFSIGANNKGAFIYTAGDGIKTCKNPRGYAYCYNIGHTAFCDSEAPPGKKRSLRIRNKH